MTAIITIPGLNLSDDFPIYAGGSAFQNIVDNAADIGLDYWGLAKAANVTQDTGAISSWKDVLGGAETFSQATSARRAVLTADQINGFDAAAFTAANFDYYPFSSFAPTSIWSIIALFKFDSSQGTANGRGILGQQNSGSDTNARGLYRSSTGNLLGYNRAHSITIATGMSSDEWHLAVLSGTDDTFRGRIDNGDVVPGTAAGTDTTVPPLLGSWDTNSPTTNAWPGTVKSVMLSFSTDWLDPANADKLAPLIEYHRGTYGLWDA